MSSPYVHGSDLGTPCRFCTVLRMSGERAADEEDRARGERIKKLRLALGFESQEKFAEHADMERVVYNRIETGKSRLQSPKQQQRLAEALGITRGVLVDYIGDLITLEEVKARREGRWVDVPERYPVVGELIRHLQVREADPAAVLKFREMVGRRKGDLTSAEEAREIWRRAQSEARTLDEILGTAPVIRDQPPPAPEEEVKRLAAPKRKKRKP